MDVLSGILKIKEVGDIENTIIATLRIENEAAMKIYDSFKKYECGEHLKNPSTDEKITLINGSLVYGIKMVVTLEK